MAGLFFFESCILVFLLWIIVEPFLKQVTLANVIISLILSIVNLASIYFYNYYPKSKIGSKYWFIQYIWIGVLSYGIIKFWIYFSKNLKLTTFEFDEYFFYLLVCGIIYQVISILLLLKKNKFENQNIGGITGDFIEQYLNNSALVYTIPIILLNIFLISQLSRMLIIVAYISLFVMPNVMSLKFLNYNKITGDIKNVLINYGKSILFFQLTLAITGGILCKLNIVYIVLMLILLSSVTAFRIWIATLVAKSKHEDTQKVDYYAVAMFVPVILLAAMAFFWR